MRRVRLVLDKDRATPCGAAGGDVDVASRRSCTSPTESSMPSSAGTEHQARRRLAAVAGVARVVDRGHRRDGSSSARRRLHAARPASCRSTSSCTASSSATWQCPWPQPADSRPRRAADRALRARCSAVNRPWAQAHVLRAIGATRAGRSGGRRRRSLITPSRSRKTTRGGRSRCGARPGRTPTSRLAASAGCDTSRCQTTAWNSSTCGVRARGRGRR